MHVPNLDGNLKNISVYTKLMSKEHAKITTIQGSENLTSGIVIVY